MNKIICISFFFCCISFLCSAQTDFNVELQVYPTGVIPGIRIENKIGEKTKVHLRLGLNIFDHRDLGVQDNESGWGYGFTLGGSKTLGQSKFELGLRNDVWFNNVDWTDERSADIVTGMTDIVVLQPTVELSYRLAAKKLIVRPSLAVGAEWNVRTVGDPTGQGLILLLGVIIGIP